MKLMRQTLSPSRLLMTVNLKVVDGATIQPKHKLHATAAYILTTSAGRTPHNMCLNVACLVGINPLKIPLVPTYDGVNHPADRKEFI